MMEKRKWGYKDEKESGERLTRNNIKRTRAGRRDERRRKQGMR